MRFRDNDRIQLTISKEILNQSFNRDDMSQLNEVLEYDFFYSRNEKEQLKLRIYYTPELRVYDYVKNVVSAGYNILDFLDTNIEAQEKVYDFSKSTVLEMVGDTGYWEQGKTYFEIIIDSVYYSTSRRFHEYHLISNIDERGIIVFNDVFSSDYFTYDKPYQYSVIPKTVNYVDFGSFQLDINAEFETNIYVDNVKQVTIDRFIELNLSKLYEDEYDDVDEIINANEVVVKSISIYFEVPFLNLSYTCELHSLSLNRLENDAEPVVATDGDKTLSFPDNGIIEFLSSLNFDKLINHTAFFSSVVDQYLFSLPLSNEAKFMIQYNVIEQFRNYYMTSLDPDKYRGLTDEYVFVTGKKKTGKSIRKGLREMSELLSESSKEEYLSDVPGKANALQKRSMTIQLVEFFKEASIEFDINELKVIIGLRNEIYHGHIVIENREAIAHGIEILEKLNTKVFENFMKS